VTGEARKPWKIMRTTYVGQVLRDWDGSLREELLDQLVLVSDDPVSQLVRAGPEFKEFEWQYTYLSHVTGDVVFVLFENMNLETRSIDCMFVSRKKPHESDEPGFGEI
jgi:hypothetical protein